MQKRIYGMVGASNLLEVSLMFAPKTIAALSGALFLFCANAEAIILFRTADPTANTTAPTGELAGSGWQFQGTFGEFLGTPIAPHFFITAKHLGGGGTTKFTYRGKDYPLGKFFDDPGSDLRIWEVAEAFPDFAPLYTKSDEVGRPFVVFGSGTQRGKDRVVSGQLRGWEWGFNDHVQRWGENQVASITSRGGETLSALFDQAGLTHEAHLSSGDSGGALFIKDGAVWKLAGINYDVDRFASGPTGGGPYDAAMFDQRGSYMRNGTLVSGDVPVPSGFYATRISSRVGWITSVISPRLANISARSNVGSAERVAISGFIVRGNAGQSKRLLVRALGPSLQVNGVPIARRISDPVLEVRDGSGAAISSNDNWRGPQAGEIESLGFAPPDEREAALVATLPVGNYTAILRSGDGSSGPGLIEIYDLDGGSGSRLLNLSARAFVGLSDEVLIGGLIVHSAAKRMVLRALGPSLAAQGVTNAMQNPAFELYNSAGAIVASNDNWQEANSGEIFATGLAPTDTREAAILFTPNLGTYTAVVRGAGNTNGVALLEAYLVD